MTEERESDADLIARHKRVEELYLKAKKSAERCKPGGTRDRKMRWAGSLNFTLIGIQSEMEERGLTPA